MRKLQKATVVAVVLGSFGFLGARTAYADGGQQGGRGGTGFEIRQGSSCRSHDMNVDVLGEVGILNGVLGNALGGEGSPGAQSTTMGSSMGCNNTFDGMAATGGTGGGGERGGGSEGREGHGGGEAGGGGEASGGGSEGSGRDEGSGRGGDSGRGEDKVGSSDGGEGHEGKSGNAGKEGGDERMGGEGPVHAISGQGGE
ncbi:MULTISPECIES: hypothetical protein [unclassified Streptomyces]|uniref:hypothetical protein n=1 Tax=unclassified Streptomyces TaxID=2593676 RepID=UPI00036188B3|nr:MULTISPECIES: hypothetical protein [unclassified Streptomyces]